VGGSASDIGSGLVFGKIVLTEEGG